MCVCVCVHYVHVCMGLCVYLYLGILIFPGVQQPSKQIQVFYTCLKRAVEMSITSFDPVYITQDSVDPISSVSHGFSTPDYLVFLHAKGCVYPMLPTSRTRAQRS